MDIAYRLRQLREWRHLSQGDIEKRTGLLRCYVSRVENGHTIPSIETLEKLSRALEVPMYQLFYSPEPPHFNQNWIAENGDDDWASRGRGQNAFVKLRNALASMSNSDRRLLLFMARKMVAQKKR